MASTLLDKIRKQAVRAISEYDMIESGDKILLAISGGKDSAVMLLIFEQLIKKSPFPFSYQAVLINQHNPGFAPEAYLHWFKERGIDIAVIDDDTYAIVRDKLDAEQTPCGLCARLRRGILYTYAHKHGFTKIALGHHRDDLNETLLLNLFFAGKIASMPPKLRSDDQRNTVIRPLCYVAEKDLIALSGTLAIPATTCTDCIKRFHLQRTAIKQLIATLEKENRSLSGSLLTAQQNIRPSQLMDKRFWQF